MTKIFMVNRKAWKFLFFGLLGCLLSGFVMPAFALFYSEIFNVSYLMAFSLLECVLSHISFQVFSEPVEQLEGDAIFWSLMFLALGFVQGGGFFISVINFLLVTSYSVYMLTLLHFVDRRTCSAERAKI